MWEGSSTNLRIDTNCSSTNLPLAVYPLKSAAGSPQSNSGRNIHCRTYQKYSRRQTTEIALAETPLRWIHLLDSLQVTCSTLANIEKRSQTTTHLLVPLRSIPRWPLPLRYRRIRSKCYTSASFDTTAVHGLKPSDAVDILCSWGSLRLPLLW